MAYDEGLAQRVREALGPDPALSEKRMFGGLAFLYRGHMFVGVSGSELMGRVGKPLYLDSLSRPHVREMDFTGRPLQGYVYLAPQGIDTDAELRFWVLRCRQFVAGLPAKAPKAGKASGVARRPK